MVTEDMHEVGARQYEISDRSELRIRYGDKWWETRKKKKSKDIISSFTLLYMTWSVTRPCFLDIRIPPPVLLVRVLIYRYVHSMSSLHSILM